MNGTESLSYWLIVREERNRIEVLTVWLAGSGEALPVFSFEEETRSFCERKGLGSGWLPREISTEELALVLFGLCADVERIALDPLPQAGAEMLVALTYMRCEDFLEFLFRENTSHDTLEIRKAQPELHQVAPGSKWPAKARRSVSCSKAGTLRSGSDGGTFSRHSP